MTSGILVLRALEFGILILLSVMQSLMLWIAFGMFYFKQNTALGCGFLLGAVIIIFMCRKAVLDIEPICSEAYGKNKH